ncbi:MAG TPA: hypothetical protein VMZ22_05065 [Acidimicrobiales bacterium]|nr:hypothetical protein [Acidimicrobiales bacterium]
MGAEHCNSDDVILVRHGRPNPGDSTQSSEWRLSADGEAACAELGRLLLSASAAQVVANDEPKAIQTARLSPTRWRASVGSNSRRWR